MSLSLRIKREKKKISVNETELIFERNHVQHPSHGAVELGIDVSDVIENDGFVEEHFVKR
jgi:hypothetical protein